MQGLSNPAEDCLADITIRLLSPDDSLGELTALLHHAYRALAENGFRYVASHQTEEVTARRVARGVCLVASDGRRLLGTITLRLPGDGTGCPFYEQPGVAILNQFAVLPEYQRRGIGALLLDAAERRAAAADARLLALDTSEGALDLIAYYQRRGFSIVGEVDWRPSVNYRSVVLARSLTAAGRSSPARA